MIEEQGVSAAGADEFRLGKQLLTDAGYTDAMSVLDYGCGWGSLLTVIHPEDYLGVDISPLMIAEAQKRFPERRFEVSEFGKTQGPPKDVVIAHSVFTHIPKELAGECLSEVRDSLKEGGFALIDIFSKAMGYLCEWYTEREWLALVGLAGLKADLVGTRQRNQFFTHHYYKVQRV